MTRPQANLGRSHHDLSDRSKRTPVQIAAEADLDDFHRAQRAAMVAAGRTPTVGWWERALAESRAPW
jgi:hypothetical protein